MKWLKAWWETNNYKKWNQYTDHEIYEIVEPGLVVYNLAKCVKRLTLILL
jgi:hypothetical protein